MPSRLVTAAILAFWLLMTGWLIHREVVPMMLADASPTYVPDLTDEIGSPVIAWTILRDGKRIGMASSRVLPGDNRSFEFQSSYNFSNFTYGPADIRQMDVSYKVTEEGRLLGLSTKFSVAVPMLGLPPTKTELKGEVRNGELEPRLYLDGVEQKMRDIGKINVAQQGNIINPMHLLNHLRGLYPGRTWTIPMLHPMSGLQKQVQAPSALIARVKLGNLSWNRKEVICYEIEYHEPGKEVSARTWVRKLDDLVLQQETSQLGFDMVLQRVP